MVERAVPAGPGLCPLRRRAGALLLSASQPPPGAVTPDRPRLRFQTVLANVLSLLQRRWLCVAEPICTELLEHMLVFIREANLKFQHGNSFY